MEERASREQEFKDRFKAELPEFVKACIGKADVVILHQDAFAADYQEEEFALLGRAIKYAGLCGKLVQVIGHNTATLSYG